MPWLRLRLRAVNATASDLARHLKLPPVRVYEMIKGKRRFQPNEVAKAASFLKIGEAQLLQLIEGRIDVKDVGIDHVIALPWADASGVSVPLLRATLSLHGLWLLHANEENGAIVRPDLIRFSQTAFTIVIQDERNSPVYRARDCILIDPDIPVSLGDDVVLSTAVNLVAGNRLEVIPGQLTKMSEAAWSLKQYAIGAEHAFSRTQFPSAWRIVSRFMPV